jgi:hypothetical protein
MRNLLFAAAAALALAAGGASAAPFTGTISTFGDATGSGPWNLTSETTGTYSGVAITATSSTTFSELSDLNAVFQDIAGGAYGGSPRLSIGFVGSSDFLHIYLGTSPNFTDSDPALFTAGWSGTNVIGNNDSGRYDTSQFVGGNVVSDYTDTLALLGNLSISEIDLVMDGGWGANGRQELLACSINVNDASFGSGCSRQVDDVPTLPVVAAGMGLGFLALRRKRKRAAA